MPHRRGKIGMTVKIGSICAHGTVDQKCMNINSGRMDLLTRLLNAASVRHDVIAQNISNVNTPGYQTLEVNFEAALKESLESGAKAQSVTVTPQIEPGKGGVTRADGNNVDIDMELTRLQKNTLLFKVYTQLLALEVAQFRSAIAGR
jgi:flagellar basal-body rod protein FlgB